MLDDALDATAVLAALPCSDLPRTEAFVERLVGRPADLHPMPGLAEWTWGGCTLQLVDDARRAGGGLATILVADLEATVAGAGGRGIALEVAEGATVARFASVEDPDGNRITIVQPA